MVRWCWVNFQYRGVLLIWIRVGQEPTALAVGAGGGLFGHFFSRLLFLFSIDCLKGLLSPKQPTNQVKSAGSHLHMPVIV